MSEYEAVARGMGRWNRDDPTPKFGWECIKVRDLGKWNYQTCEMCESARIRFVHHMRHPDSPVRLEVGCICAGHMERTSEEVDVRPFIEAAEARDRDIRNRAQRAAGRNRSGAKAAETLDRLTGELEQCDHSEHCRIIVTDLNRLHRLAEERAAKAERDEFEDEAKQHNAFAEQIDAVRTTAMDKLRALEEREALVEQSAEIWMALENPNWVRAKNGTRVQAYIGPHRIWTWKRNEQFKIAGELQGGGVSWGRRTYRTEAEACAMLVRALTDALLSKAMLLPRDDSAVTSAIRERVGWS